MASLIVRASASKPDFKTFRARAEERRAALETARTLKVQRIQQDIDRIVKREREYSRKLLEEIVPVRVIFNDDGWKRLQELLPFRIEPIAAAAPDEAAADGADAGAAAALKPVPVAAAASDTIPSARGTSP